jgi:hypothetical protein
VIECSFLTIEEIEKISDRIRAVIHIFEGQDPEFDDLKKLEQRLNMFREDFMLFNDINLSNNELEKMVGQRIETVSQSDKKDGMLPEWRSPKEIYGSMLNVLMEKRKARSSEWVNTIFPSSDEISRMSAEQCHRIFSETERLPVYITVEDSQQVEISRQDLLLRLSSLWICENFRNPEDIAEMGAEECQNLLSKLNAVPDYVISEDRYKVSEMQKALERRLDELEVKGLLARYRQLSFNLQKEFLKIAVEEFKKIMNSRTN